MPDGVGMIGNWFGIFSGTTPGWVGFRGGGWETFPPLGFHSRKDANSQHLARTALSARVWNCGAEASAAWGCTVVGGHCTTVKKLPTFGRSGREQETKLDYAEHCAFCFVAEPALSFGSALAPGTTLFYCRHSGLARFLEQRRVGWGFGVVVGKLSPTWASTPKKTRTRNTVC